VQVGWPLCAATHQSELQGWGRDAKLEGVWVRDLY